MTRLRAGLLAIAGGVALGWLGGAGWHGIGPESQPTALPYYGDRDFTPRWSPVRHRIGPFSLVAQTGATVRDSDLAGTIHVASFLFTTCPSVCPTLVTRLKPVQERAREWPDVRLVSYSVTPESDTPPVLAGFGEARGIEPAKWLLLTGDGAQIARLFRESYFADDERALPGADGSKLLHSEKVLLVDAQLRLRGVYDGTLAIEIEHLIADVERLRTQAPAPEVSLRTSAPDPAPPPRSSVVASGQRPPCTSRSSRPRRKRSLRPPTA